MSTSLHFFTLPPNTASAMAGCQLPRTSALLRGLLPAKPPRNLELWVLISVDWVKELLMGACGFCVLLTNQRNSIWQGHYRSQDSGLKAQVDTWDGHKCWKCQQSESRNTPASQDNGSSLTLSLYQRLTFRLMKRTLRVSASTSL